MKKFFLLLCFIPVYALAQKFSVDRPDEMIKQDPYTSAYFADNNNYKPVESVITIARNRYSNFVPDTLNIDYYNKKGLKVKNIRYDNNKVSTTTHYKYDAGDKLASWQTFEKYSSTFTVYKYNKAGQMMETHQYIINNKKGDTAEKSRMLFIYDVDKLVQITNNALGTDIIEKYAFEKNKLMEKTGGFVSKKIFYNNNELPTGINEYMGAVIDTSKIMGIEKFVYNSDGKLITDSVLTTSNLKTNTYQVIEYTYNDKGMISTMNTQFKNLYRNVVFTFADGKMQAVHVETNGNSAFLKFIMYYRIDEYYSYPLKYHEQFSYDKMGNRTSKKAFVNDELFSEVNYIITYKK